MFQLKTDVRIQSFFAITQVLLFIMSILMEFPGLAALAFLVPIIWGFYNMIFSFLPRFKQPYLRWRKIYLACVGIYFVSFFIGIFYLEYRDDPNHSPNEHLAILYFFILPFFFGIAYLILSWREFLRTAKN
ncbi:MAG: hypothetical protein JJT94_08070 [Bernardetiaceae bacterium]|nr:hypothetical protein [Bernardetiaceae bacterium]